MESWTSTCRAARTGCCRPRCCFMGAAGSRGTRTRSRSTCLPYLAMGFAVVNVDYRVARMAPAPAAVQDSRCALRWVIRHAPQYGFDPARLVLVGSSAGAHLALMAALAPATAGFDGLCPGNEPLTVAAVDQLLRRGRRRRAAGAAAPARLCRRVDRSGRRRRGAGDAGIAAQLRRQGGARRAHAARRRRSRRSVHAGDAPARGARSRRRAEPPGSDPRRPSR